MCKIMVSPIEAKKQTGGCVCVGGGGVSDISNLVVFVSSWSVGTNLGVVTSKQVALSMMGTVKKKKRHEAF